MLLHAAGHIVAAVRKHFSCIVDFAMIAWPLHNIRYQRLFLHNQYLPTQLAASSCSTLSRGLQVLGRVRAEDLPQSDPWLCRPRAGEVGGIQWDRLGQGRRAPDVSGARRT